MGEPPAPDPAAVDDRGPGTPSLATLGVTPDPHPDAPLPDVAIDAAPRRRGPRIFTEPMWVLGLVILMDEVDKNIVRGMITPIQDEFGVGDFAIGVLLACSLLVSGLVTVPAGYLADRWMRTRAIGRTVVVWSGLTAARRPPPSTSRCWSASAPPSGSARPSPSPRPPA